MKRVMFTKKQLVNICTAWQMEAQTIKGRLKSEVILSPLSYKSASLVYGLTVGGLGEVKILVPERLATAAKRLLNISRENNKEDTK